MVVVVVMVLRMVIMTILDHLVSITGNEKVEVRLENCCVMPVCPSIRVEKVGHHWKDFHEI